MERADATGSERSALDLIRDIRDIEPSPAVAVKLDALERALRASTQHADSTREQKPRRQFGAFAGRFAIGPEFFDPMSEEDRREWGED